MYAGMGTSYDMYTGSQSFENSSCWVLQPAGAIMIMTTMKTFFVFVSHFAANAASAIRADVLRPEELAGCLTARNLQRKAQWISIFEESDKALCSAACGDSYFFTYALSEGDCFCSHHHDLSTFKEADCMYKFYHTVGIADDNQDPTYGNDNLCPDRRRFYCQTGHSINSRVTNLMSFMTVEDKIKTIGQQSVAGNYWDKTPLVSREYRWWSEALHGLEPNHEAQNAPCGKVCPTQFAEANALSCAWNTSLWYETAVVIGTEARAYWNERANQGLTFYAPQINLGQPLWGRIKETPGEDPYLTSQFAIQYVRGLQGDHPRVLKAAATPKHFIGHLFEGEGSDPYGNGTMVSRVSNDTRFSLQDLEQYYLPPFRAALKDAKAESLMCAYQSVNGVPMCANGFLLNRVLREEWNWTGFVVSDCDAIETMQSGLWWNNLSFHQYSPDKVAAVRDGVRAGCDQNCGITYVNYGMEAYKKGLITKNQIDTLIYRQLRTLFRLGMFDPKEDDPYSSYGWNQVGTDFNRQLALEGAQQSIVLLQNGDLTPVLPISKGQRVLLAGPMYNATDALLGNYHGSACPDGTGSCLKSLNDWLRDRVELVQALPGVPAGCKEDSTGIDEVIDAASNADIVVLALGGGCHEDEGADRDFLHLPGSQRQLYRAVYQTETPLAVVLINGGPFAIDELKAWADIAILQAGYPGQSGAQAITGILTGEVNPSGKLTVTIYPESYTNGKPMSGTPWMTSALRPMEGTEGRSHMFYTGTPLYPFGYGLSYTTFLMQWETEPPSVEWSYDDLKNAISDTDSFDIIVLNNGEAEGKETIQAYWSPPKSVDAQLKRQLFAFESVVLQPGQSCVIRFPIKTALKSISTVSPRGDRVVFPGNYTIVFTRGHGDILQTQVTATSYYMVRKFPSPWVDKHEVIMEACVEGTHEIIPHTEEFLMAYKLWKWEKHLLKHVASGKCLTFDEDCKIVNLQRCSPSNQHQEWTHQTEYGGMVRPKICPTHCLKAMASSALEVRSAVALTSSNCNTPGAKWKLLPDGLLRSLVPDGNATEQQQYLCLAATSEGRFNYHN
jgi:beta-glucosidase-like glycosyl hydrolase